jgi:hypothetical protein
MYHRLISRLAGLGLARDVGLVVAAGLALSLPVVSLMRRMRFGLEPHEHGNDLDGSFPAVSPGASRATCLRGGPRTWTR